MSNVTDSMVFFDPARLPARDADGMLFHPDLDDPRWQHPEFEEYLNPEAFKVAGLETSSVLLEYDVADDHPAAVAYYDNGDMDLSAWEPSKPEGEGWRLIAIYDAEDSLVALYVRAITHQEPEQREVAN